MTIRPTIVLKLVLPPPTQSNLGVSHTQFQQISSYRRRTLPPNSKFPFHFARHPHTLWNLSLYRIVYAGPSSSAILMGTPRSYVVPYHCIYLTIAFLTKRNLRRQKPDDCSSEGLKCEKGAAPIMSSYLAIHRTSVTESRTCTCQTKPSCVSSIPGYTRASVQCNLRWIKTVTGDTATLHRVHIRLSRHITSHLP